MPKIKSISVVRANKINKTRTQAMESKVVGAYAVDLLRHRKDVFTPSAKENELNSEISVREALKEHAKFFVKRGTNNSLKEDVLKNPQLCNDAILMCLDTYDKKQHQIRDWTLSKRIRNDENGFCANVYKREGEIAIAFGATNDKLDVLTDVQMARGIMPNQFGDAKKLFDEIKKENPDSKIILTGTSLGGSLSELLASADEDVLAVTFNAYGVSNIIKNNPELKDFKNSYNYITKGDPVSRSSSHIGNVIQKRQSAFIAHSISNFFGYFKED